MPEEKRNEDEVVAAELEAMNQLFALLAPLDIDSRARVIEWADKFLVKSPLSVISKEAEAGLLTSIKVLEKQAEKLGVPTDRLVHAYSALREREGLAPVTVREGIERAEEELRAQTA